MPTAADESAGRRRALVVATGTYADTTLAQLRAPGQDAAELAAVLEDAAIGGFEVETVLDAPADALRRQVARFCAQGGPRDLALVYLSCHGVLDDRGRLYYATVDTDRELLAATAVPSAWLNEQLEDCRARRQILVLDCCHSGAFAKGAKGEGGLALRERFEGRGRVVLTGSRATEYSFEHGHVVGEGASSVFTRALVEGLRSGDADRDGDGAVSVSELYDYAYEVVREGGARQTPTLWSYAAEGDLLVAHSPRGAIVKPAPLPEDLIALLESARPRVREGAVAELADLLAGTDPGRALTARAQLERVAAEDVPSVAAAARTALDAHPVPDAPAPPASPPPPPSSRRPGSGGAPPPARTTPPTRTGPQPPRRRTLAIAAGAIAAAAIVLVVLLAGGSEQSLEPGRIPMGGEPRGIAVGEGAIWVARHGDDKVNRIDPKTGDQEEIDVGSDPDRIAVGGGAVWVTIHDGTKMVRISPRTHEVTTRKPVPIDARRATDCENCPNPGMEIGEGALWVASAREGRISRRSLDDGTQYEGGLYELPSGYGGALAISGGAVWAVGYDEDGPSDDGTERGAWLVRIDAHAKDDETGDPQPGGTAPTPQGVAAYGNQTLWITATQETKDVVALFDPQQGDRGKDLGHVDLESGTITSEDVVAVKGAAFIWNAISGRLRRIDRDKIAHGGNAVAGATTVAGYRTREIVNKTWSDLDLADGFAWVTDPAGGAVFKVAPRPPL